MQRYIKLDAQDQPLPDDAPFEQVGGILVKPANIIVAPFELTKGERAPFKKAIQLAADCKHLEKEWRLATIDELFFVADRAKYDPAIDTNFFPFLSDGGWAWSSTVHASDSSYAWFVYLSGGLCDDFRQANYGLVLAVRSASQ